MFGFCSILSCLPQIPPGRRLETPLDRFRVDGIGNSLRPVLSADGREDRAIAYAECRELISKLGLGVRLMGDS